MPLPDDLLALPPPRDPADRLRSRSGENARALALVGGLGLLGAAAVWAPVPARHAVLFRMAAGLLVVVLLRVLAVRLRRSAVWPPELLESASLYRAGDLPAASARLEAVHLAPLHPAVRAVAVAWKGLLALRQGDAALATARLAEVVRSGHGREPALRWALGGVPGLLALAVAVDGDLERARRWLAQVPPVDVELGRGTQLLAHVYLALRSGDAPSARRLALERWAAAEALLAPAEVRGLRVLVSLSEPDPALATRWRMGARPGWPGELDYLAQGWPELEAYLQTHGLSGSARP